ncbi:MAG: hypothetical protein WKG07_20080 [Hymenobacter sp.]
MDLDLQLPQLMKTFSYRGLTNPTRFSTTRTTCDFRRTTATSSPASPTPTCERGDKAKAKEVAD